MVGGTKSGPPGHMGHQPEARGQRNRGQGPNALANPTLFAERLQSFFEGFSLTGYEARVLVALVRLGQATAKQVSALTDISQPNVYPVLDSLAGKNLVQRRPGSRATWVAPGAGEVVARLEAAEARRLQAAHEALQERARAARSLAQELSAEEAIRGTEVQVLAEAEAGQAYEEAMPSVRDEVLVFNKGPYSGDLGVSQPVLDALRRGVNARAMYQEFELGGPDGEALRRAADGYHAAGVDQRVAEALPLSLAVLDRSLVVMSLPGDDHEDPYPTNVLVRNQAFAELQATAFDHIWEGAQPYQPTQPYPAQPARGPWGVES